MDGWIDHFIFIFFNPRGKFRDYSSNSKKVEYGSKCVWNDKTHININTHGLSSVSMILFPHICVTPWFYLLRPTTYCDVEDLLVQIPTGAHSFEPLASPDTALRSESKA